MKRETRRTLLEAAVVLGTLLAIVLGVAVPSILSSIQRARQKRTMGDMRSIGTAAESYSIDFNAYPPSAAGTIPIVYGGLGYPTTTVGAVVARYISPTYLKETPLSDGWSSWFLYTSGNRMQDYAVASAARDGRAIAPVRAGPTTDFDTDIVFSDGQFTVYPEGVCQ